MIAVSVLASSHNVKNLDPIDKVTILNLRNHPKAREILRGNWKTEKYTPFDPVSKRITSVVTCDGVRYTAAKGAPKSILSLSNCSAEVAKLYRNKASEFARRGFRSLGVAIQKEGEDWQLLGMYPMFDPPREDTAHTITEAQNLGLSVKMLTGDAIAIAKETCKMLALGELTPSMHTFISSYGSLTCPCRNESLQFRKADPRRPDRLNPTRSRRTRRRLRRGLPRA